MKKRIACIITLLSIMFIFSACVDTKTRNDIIDTMTKADVIEDDWEYVYCIVQDQSPIPDISYYDYVYRDGKDLYSIRIHNRSDDGTYMVELGKNIEISEYVYERSDEEDVVDRHVDKFITIATYRLKYQRFLLHRFMVMKKET